MPGQDPLPPDSELDLAEAFKELARGERTADALENQLSSIEKRIEELLERADIDQKDLDQQSEQANAATSSSDAQAGKANSSSEASKAAHQSENSEKKE